MIACTKNDHELLAEMAATQAVVDHFRTRSLQIDSNELLESIVDMFIAAIPNETAIENEETRVDANLKISGLVDLWHRDDFRREVCDSGLPYMLETLMERAFRRFVARHKKEMEAKLRACALEELDAMRNHAVPPYSLDAFCERS